jgi:hypothetical protein
LCSKLDNPEFINFVKSFDIVTITETYISTEFENTLFKDYCCFTSKATKLSHYGRRSGGVIVLIRKYLEKYIERLETDLENTVVIKISKQLLKTSKDVMYISVYIPPHDSPFWSLTQNGHGVECLEKCVIDLYDKYTDFFLFVTGDFNSRTADRNISPCNVDCDISDKMENEDSTFKRLSCDKVVNVFGEQLLDFCSIFECAILNGLVTHGYDASYTYICQTGSSIVDYFLMSCNMLCELKTGKFCVRNIVESDHQPVEFVLYLKTSSGERRSTDNKRNNLCYLGKKLIWDKEKESEYINVINSVENKEQIDEAASLLNEDVDAALNSFVKCMKSAAQCMSKPCGGKQNGVTNKWFDEECRKAKKVCNRMLRVFRKVRSENTRKDFVESRNKYKQLLRQKKREYNKKTAQNLLDNVKDSAAFWRNVKKLGGWEKRSNDNQITINEWYHHFKSIFQDYGKLQEEDVQYDMNEADCGIGDLNKEISEDEVLNAVKKLNDGKAGGIDGIVTEMLKAGGEVVINFLTKLFNHIFDHGIYPKEWSKAIVIPLHKKGNTNLPENYRGISLISVICKCYTSVLNSRLYSYLEENNKLIENQAGFRQNYSTTDQIFNLYAAVQKCLNKKGRKLYVAFIDLKKAFDSVNHDLLLNAIHSAGVTGKFFISLKAMYSSLISCVRVNNEYSDFFDCPVGVRQGCVLSPTLFSLFINDLANHVNDCGLHGVQLLPTLLELFILLFADDIVLLSLTPGGLQVQLNILKDCCDRLKLIVNKEKTKIMVFRKGGYLGRKEKWHYEGEKIEVVNSYSYLGFTFSTMLSCKIGTNHLVTKGKKATYLICKAFKNCKDMSQKVFFKIFDARVQSILLYSSEVWGLQRLDTLERIHLLACKRFLGVPIKTPNKMVYSELGRYPIYINSTLRVIKYWFRLLHMNEDRLPKQAYLMMIEEDLNGRKCWVSQVRELLCTTGYNYVWLNQGVPNETSFLSSLKQRLIDLFIQEWYVTVRDKDRYVFYRSIVSNFGSADYLLHVDIYCFRVVMTQMRLGVLPINSNRCRYSDSAIDKMCPYCANAIENEEHVFRHCPLYKDLRKRYCSLNYESASIAQYFDSKNSELSRNTAKYIFFAMRRRQRFLSE